MKKTLLLAFLAAPAFLFAQSGSYTLKGKVGNKNKSAKAYLIQTTNDSFSADSAVVKNGSFEFKGTVTDPVRATLVLDHQGKGLQALQRGADALDIYLEKGTITLSTPDSIYKAKITGSELNNKNQQLKADLKPIHEKMSALMATYKAAPIEQQQSEAFQAEIGDKFTPLMEEQKQVLVNFIKQNPGSPISLDALKSFAGQAPVYADVAPLYDTLAPSIKNSTDGKAYGAYLDQLKKTAIGEVAPDFTQSTPEGKAVKLSDFRGKYVLLDFWASWCGPCRIENPNIVQVYNKYKDKNFTILSVSLDSEKSKDAWLKAIEDDQLTWTHVSDLKAWGNEVARQYDVMSIPQNYLIGPDGRIVAKNLRGEELGEKLEQIIGKP